MPHRSYSSRSGRRSKYATVALENGVARVRQALLEMTLMGTAIPAEVLSDDIAFLFLRHSGALPSLGC